MDIGLQAMLNLILSYFFITLLTVLSGCAAPTPDISKDGFHYKFEDPDQYVVDSKNYPAYRIEKSIYRPPTGLVKGMLINHPDDEMSTADIWRVTHVYNGYYYIFSDEYQKRHMQNIKKSGLNEFGDRYLYHLPIDTEGHVIGGWVYFKNKKLVLLPSERKIVFDPSYWRNPEWDKQPSFKATKE